jgi:hypothetical protein
MFENPQFEPAGSGARKGPEAAAVLLIEELYHRIDSERAETWLRSAEAEQLLSYGGEEGQALVANEIEYKRYEPKVQEEPAPQFKKAA